MRFKDFWDDIKTHFEEWWIIYLWICLLLGLIIWGVIECNGNVECVQQLENSIK